ncbi:eukaryotic translation initiation factor 4 gamma-like [Spodoptera frugiperda]|uniref:Eukaryotic translation initiation factor 4 gamma-like n=1 Tax=Spodoptera frugiperda TaxID=7108 RepID=A0A9R0EQL6_SPOFR|nr:eukaryotic translation initiation factor 4 gamma-like [Spodoptera frugiperda]
MHFILLGFFIFKLQTTVAQYPTHTDLQKVGEVIFNNEKYSVLKPTEHVVTDYFKDFMLRRENINFPTKRVFIDNNGFRHAWSGFENKVQSLRKTDLKNVVLNSENFTDSVSTEKGSINVTSTEVAQNTTEAAETTSKAIETNIETVQSSTKTPVSTTEAVKTTTDTTETTTDANVPTTEVIETTAKSNNNITSKETPMNLNNQDNATESETEESEEKSLESVTKVPNSVDTTTFRVLFRASIQSNTNITVTTNEKIQGRQGKNKTETKPTNERTVVQTTFFCPFFGIITMSGFVD